MSTIETRLRALEREVTLETPCPGCHGERAVLRVVNPYALVVEAPPPPCSVCGRVRLVVNVNDPYATPVPA